MIVVTPDLSFPSIAAVTINMVAGIAWWLPLVIGGGSSLLSSLFGNRGRGGGGIAVEKGHPLYDYLKTGQVKSSGGGSSTSTTTYSKKFDTRTEPYFTKDWASAGGLLRGKVEKRLASPSSLPPSYTSRGIQGINRSFDAMRQAVANRVAATGVGGAPLTQRMARAAEVPRAQQTSDFLSNVPLVERSLENEDMQLAQAIIEAFGRGQHQWGTESGTSKTDSSESHSSTSFDPSVLLKQLEGQAGRRNWADTLGDIGGLAALLLGSRGDRNGANPEDAWDLLANGFWPH